MPALSKHAIRGGVGASSVPFHHAGPKDIVFISESSRQHVTGHGAWHHTARSPCPFPGLWRMLNTILGRATHYDATEERVGKKGWGRLVFSAFVKNQDWLCRLGSGYSRPARQLRVSCQAWCGKSSDTSPVSAPSCKAQPFWGWLAWQYLQFLIACLSDKKQNFKKTSVFPFLQPEVIQMRQLRAALYLPQP